MSKISNYNIVKEYKDKIIVYNSYTKANIFLEKGSSTKAFEDIDEFNKLDENTKNILMKNQMMVVMFVYVKKDIIIVFHQVFLDYKKEICIAQIVIKK